MILRKEINRPLTHDEMDTNFKELEAKTQIALLSKTDDIIKIENLIMRKMMLRIFAAKKIILDGNFTNTAYIKNGVYYVNIHLKTLDDYEENGDKNILTIEELENHEIFIQTFDGNVLSFENGILRGTLKKNTQYALSFSGVL